MTKRDSNELADQLLTEMKRLADYGTSTYFRLATFFHPRYDDIFKYPIRNFNLFVYLRMKAIYFDDAVKKR